MRHGDFLASNPDETQPVRKPGSESEQNQKRKQEKEKLKKLSDHMRKIGLELDTKRETDPSIAQNRSIPAGYTYFAQLIAHDLVFHDLSWSRFDGNARVRRLPRTPWLDLDCLYGGGPLHSPSFYAMEANPFLPRRRLRLSQVCGTDQERRHGQGCLGAPRDLPRVSCPMAENRDSTGGPSRRPRYDTLIADPRNEDNLILSQIVVLFHRFHNILIDLLEAQNYPINSSNQFERHREQFATARNFVVKSYRLIICNDFLSRFLKTEIFKKYTSTDFKKFKYVTKEGLLTVPAEFWLGAFRAGHAMIQRSYDLGPSFENSSRRDVDIGTLLQFVGSEGSKNVPISKDWVIDDWSLFFDMEQGPGGQVTKAVNPSRLIQPTPAGTLTELFKSADGGRGLQYRDLLRAWDGKLQSAQSLIKEFAKHFAKDFKIETLPARAIERWLPDDLEDDERKDLLENTPLFFYVLCEAAEQANGKHLGELGSTIVAEVIFGALRGGDRELPEGQISPEETTEPLFPIDPPDTISKLINFVD